MKTVEVQCNLEVEKKTVDKAIEARIEQPENEALLSSSCEATVGSGHWKYASRLVRSESSPNFNTGGLDLISRDQPVSLRGNPTLKVFREEFHRLSKNYNVNILPYLEKLAVDEPIDLGRLMKPEGKADEKEGVKS